MENDSSHNRLAELAEEINLPEKSELPHLPSTPVKKSNGLLKIFMFFAILLIVGLVITIVVSAIMFFNKGREKKEQVSDTVQTEQESNEYIDENEEQEIILKKIAYIWEGNLWVMNDDGSSKMQLTNYQNEDIYKTLNIVWKTGKEISYSRCEDNCSIYTYDLVTEKNTKELTIEDATSVRSIDWDVEGKIVAYYYSDKDDHRIVGVSTGTHKEIKRWENPILGRGGILDDTTAISISDDGSYVFVNDTIAMPEQEALAVFDVSTGLIEYKSLIGEESENVSNAQWIDNDTLIYKDGKDALISVDVETGEKKSLDSQFNYYDMLLSVDKKSLLVWREKGTNSTETLIYNISTKSITAVLDDFAYAKWIDADSIVGLTTVPSEGILPFETESWARVEDDGTGFKIFTSEYWVEVKPGI